MNVRLVNVVYIVYVDIAVQVSVEFREGALKLALLPASDLIVKRCPFQVLLLFLLFILILYLIFLSDLAFLLIWLFSWISLPLAQNKQVVDAGAALFEREVAVVPRLVMPGGVPVFTGLDAFDSLVELVLNVKDL